MGMYMKLNEVNNGDLPDFMVWSGETDLPTVWQPFQSPIVAIAASLLFPMVVAYLIGKLVFQRRIRGAYFALITQALAAALVIWMIGQQGLTGGTNGLTNFITFFGLNLREENGSSQMSRVLCFRIGLAGVASRVQSQPPA